MLGALQTPALVQEAIDLLDQGIVCFDPQGQLVCFNRRYTELLELPDTLMARQPSKREVVAFQRQRGDFESPGRFSTPKAGPSTPILWPMRCHRTIGDRHARAKRWRSAWPG
mgnify:CR=1 FL=1